MSNYSNSQNKSGSHARQPDESEFSIDSVERSEAVLTDVRTVRPKAPRRCPPTSAARLTSGPSSAQLLQKPDLTSPSSSNNSSDDESVVERKPRAWEKPKVRWIDELKAVQAKKAASVCFGQVSRAFEPGSVPASMSSPSVMALGTDQDEEQEGFGSIGSPTAIKMVVSMDEVRITTVLDLVVPID